MRGTCRVTSLFVGDCRVRQARAGSDAGREVSDLKNIRHTGTSDSRKPHILLAFVYSMLKPLAERQAQLWNIEDYLVCSG